HGRRKNIWVNVPVVEEFAKRSPFLLRNDVIVDERDGAEYDIEIPAEPHWYSRLTSYDVPMSRIGVLQGNYLGIYVSNRCLYWTWSPSMACKFCTTGANVGTAEESRKRVEDVIEVARAAREESGCIFTHFNTGYHYEDRAEREVIHGLRQCEPYVRAVREHVGGFIGVQAVPVPRQSYHEYDELIAAGTDHFSFCYEFEDPEVFARHCPGKAKTMGQKVFFDAMEYTSKKLGRGRGLESPRLTARKCRARGVAQAFQPAPPDDVILNTRRPVARHRLAFAGSRRCGYGGGPCVLGCRDRSYA